MNLLSLPHFLPKEELIETIHAGKNVRIERIISVGQTSPEGFWYDQDEDEWLILLQGAATLRFESEVVQLLTGNPCFIPAHCRHRVDYTSANPPCIWLCVFSKP